MAVAVTEAEAVRVIDWGPDRVSALSRQNAGSYSRGGNSPAIADACRLIIS